MSAPSVGSIVTFYTHEHSGPDHITIDALGIVMAVAAHSVDLKVIKAGVLPYDVKAVEFDAAAFAKLPPAERQVGLSYWRSLGSKAPDFAAAFKPATPAETAAEAKAKELEALKAKHRKELLDLGLVASKPIMDARHEQELKDFEAKHKLVADTHAKPIASIGMDPPARPVVPPSSPLDPTARGNFFPTAEHTEGVTI